MISKESGLVRYAYGVATALLIGGTAFSVATGPVGAQVAQNAPAAMPPRGAPQSFADLAARLLPAVVNISTRQRVPVRTQADPFEEFFRRFGVPQVALHRADVAGLPRARLAVRVVPGLAGRAVGFDFDRIAERRAGAVRFEIGERAGIDVAGPPGVEQDFALGGRIGSGQAVGAAVVVGGAGAEHGVDRVAGGQGIGQGTEQDGGHSFAGDEAIGPLIERAAAAAGGQRAHRLEGGEVGQPQVEMHAAGHGELARATAQTVHRQMHGHQRTRTSGIHRHRRTTEIQEVRQPTGQDGGRTAGRPVGGGRIGGVGRAAAAVIRRPGADEGAGPRAGQCRAAVAGMLQRVVSRLEEQALTGVHLPGFGRRQTEEQGIEAGHVGQEAGGEP